MIFTNTVVQCLQWSLRLTSCISLNDEDLTSKLLNSYHVIVSEYETRESSTDESEEEIVLNDESD